MSRIPKTNNCDVVHFQRRADVYGVQNVFAPRWWRDCFHVDESVLCLPSTELSTPYSVQSVLEYDLRMDG